MAIKAAEYAAYEHQRMREREAAWPSRIVLPPPTPSFNTRSPMGSRASTPTAVAAWGSAGSRGSADAHAGLAGLAVHGGPPPPRPSTASPTRPWRSPNRRIQSASLQVS